MANRCYSSGSVVVVSPGIREVDVELLGPGADGGVRFESGSGLHPDDKAGPVTKAKPRAIAESSLRVVPGTGAPVAGSNVEAWMGGKSVVNDEVGPLPGALTESRRCAGAGGIEPPQV